MNVAFRKSLQNSNPFRFDFTVVNHTSLCSVSYARHCMSAISECCTFYSGGFSGFAQHLPEQSLSNVPNMLIILLALENNFLFFFSKNCCHS